METQLIHEQEVINDVDVAINSKSLDTIAYILFQALTPNENKQLQRSA